MLGRMIGAARLNVETFEDIEQDKGATVQAMAVVILVAIANVVGSMLAGEEVDIVGGLVFGAIMGVAGWALWALATWIIGSTLLKTEDTEADWGELARCTGFAQTPGLLRVFMFIPNVGWVIGLLVFIWQFAAMMVGVRQALDYTSLWRAFFVILLSFIPVAILYVILAIIVGIGFGVAEENAEAALRLIGIGSFMAA